jgi:paraquat-inducible protein B
MSPQRTRADVRRSRRPGFIWAVPIAAIGVALWLAVRALAQGGEKVEVLFYSAHGLEPGSSKVTYRGVKIGEVDSVAVTPDGQGAEVTLRLDRSVDKYLRSGTRFWLVGAQLSVTDLSSMRTLLSGPEIHMEPGPGERSTLFHGLDRPPPVPGRTAGTAFVLTADRRGALREGSPVFYEGEAVGVIEGARFIGPHRFEFDAFVRAPFDKLVRSDTRFWDASALMVSMQGGSLKAELVSPEALLAGAAAFDTPAAETVAASTAANGQSFRLYPDQGAAETAPTGPTVPYVVRFAGPVGDLPDGAPVRLRGFLVGRVAGRSLVWDARTGALNAPVRIELDPERLHLDGPDPRAAADSMIQRLVAQGLRARLSQDPPFLGGRVVDLDVIPGARGGRLSRFDGEAEIPSAPSGDLQAIQAKAEDVMTKLDSVPIREVGQDLRVIAARTRILVASPELKDSLDHIDSATAELDRALREAAPQIGPLTAKMRETADRMDAMAASAQSLVGENGESQNRDLPSALHALTEAARSVRALADYLQRHPEALIKGKPKEGP